MNSERAEQAAKAIAAINARDPELIGATFAPLAEIRTGRSVHKGVEAAIGWAEKRYDHLERRFSVAATHTRGDAVLVLGSVEYVWREEGEVGDTSPIALLFEFDGDLVSSMTLADDAEAALDAFESRPLG